MTAGIHVELAVSACDGCPVAALSSSTAVEDLRVDSGDDRVEFVAADPPEDPPSGLDLVEFAGRAHGRYEIACGREGAGGCRATDDAATVGGRATDDAATVGGRATDDAATDGGVVVAPPGARATAEVPSARPEADALDGPDGAAGAASADGEGPCTDCSCGGLPRAFGNFPVSPRRTEMTDGELRVSFVLTGHEELRAIVDECEAAGLDVELRRLCVDRGNADDGEGSCGDVVPVDLAGVTDRQAEIAAVAARKGYFEAGGASADEVAAEFDLAKSTVSEHLRTVTAALFSQLFGDGGST
ncbi:helix-turn-helix domain-containing protein [Halorubrum sp. AD140]|uniref:helix-turn-helix domain-containing protein n=1 Tax=Halorubrum sp. AD140 TaxID=3050073 RepID=UPI002ACC79A2|nr:helix-turn-helix domain-containing protein [Halorubrum sp. AD140]MDZ5812574.1 helix-turn-helix domain-containing protein [Halorubrum sp. AD140]